MSLLIAAICLVAPGTCTEVPFLEPRVETALIHHMETWEPPPPQRSTPSVYRGMGTNVEQWRSLVSAHFPADQVNLALCVMLHESGGNPNAKNPTSSARGLFQILGSLWAPHYGVSYSDLYDPDLNVKLAADIWSRWGWSAWMAYNRGKC